MDLIYLDPPFNSNRDYNVLFKEQSGGESPAQIKAFGDTWNWAGAAESWSDFPKLCPVPKVIELMSGFHNTIGENDVMAYLVMMAPRLYHLHRVLKPTGNLFLHVDPTASSYLRLILDSIFGPKNYKNEIIWQRTSAKALSTRNLANNHDVIFCFQKTSDAFWNQDVFFVEYDENNLDAKTASKYTHRDQDGRLYRLDNLLNPNRNRPNLTYEFLGVLRVWRWTKERMQQAFDDGLVIQTRPGSVPQLKRYLDEQKGRPVGDVWTDIPPLNSQAKERLGYPTQKPMALLERIIKASSNPGDTVLDPFCGCGTTITAAQRLNRQWIGIDITPIATTLIQKRLFDMFHARDARLKSADFPATMPTFAVEGLPTDLAGARQMYNDPTDPMHKKFEMWAVGLVPAIPQEKMGADGGIDGIAYFYDGNKNPSKAIVQVKGGKVGAPAVQQFVGAMQKEKAVIGFFITLEEPTKNMEAEALAAGFYSPPHQGGRRKIRTLQIRTIEQLLLGNGFDFPYSNSDTTFKQAERVHEGQSGLGF